MNPLLLQLGAPLLSGLLGGNRMPPEQRQLLRISTDAARRLQQYGTGIPGSAPDEQAALAQQLAQLGEEQLGQRNQLMGQMGMNPQMGQMGDMLTNLGSLQTAQRMALSSSHLFNALAQRRQALAQAAGVAQGSQGLATTQQQPNALPQLFGQLASAYAYQKAYGKNRPGATTTSGGGGFQTGSPLNMADAGSAWMNIEGAPAGWTVPGPLNNYNVLQRMGAAVAPGNEPGLAGVNGLNNQIRQGSNAGPTVDQFRRFYAGGGLTFG